MFLSRSLRFYIVPAVFAFSAQSFAGAFQVWEEDAGGIGTYHAGGAAEAITAASEFYNPAGMMNLKHQQVSFGTALIGIGVNYTGTISTSLLPSSSATDAPGDTVDAVPNFHYVLPFSNRWAFGFAVTTPFGLETDYDSVFPVDNLATKTDLETLNLNPSIAYAVNRFLSLGAGLDVLYGQAIYNSAVDWGGANADRVGATLDGWNTGYNAGLLFNISPATRFGLSYRSEIKVVAKGRSTSTLFFPATPVTSTASAQFPFPATTILSLYHDVNSRLSLMGSAFYTQWSVFKQLVIRNLATPVGISTIALNENYKNTWNLSVGGRYKLTHDISLDAGFGHDETPTRYGMRDIRLPDNDRYAGSFGVDIRPSKGFLWSMGWTHFFVPNTPIDNSSSNDASQTTPLATPAVGIGTSKGDINVFGIQFSCDI